MPSIRILNFGTGRFRLKMLVVWGLPAKGISMKTSIVATFAALLLISGASLAQEKASSPTSDYATSASAKPLLVVGQVSNDRKILMTDIDSEWSVSNPEALQGHAGRRVMVKCYVDTERNKIQILSVKKAENEATYSARSTDSAFRR